MAGRKEKSRNFRFTEQAASLLVTLAEEGGTSQVSVLERIIRDEAKRKKITLRDAKGNAPQEEQSSVSPG